jgi:hypothetical protein
MDVNTTVLRLSSALRPIDRATMPEALSLLFHGFPRQALSFWEAGFAEIQRLHAHFDHGDAPLGYLMSAGDRDVGVLLTCRSLRQRSDGTQYPVVNLSSWYVDPKFRLLAPMMLRSVLAESGSLYTDLSPSHEVARLNPHFGFKLWNDGMMIAAILPWAAMPTRSGVDVFPFDSNQGPILQPQDRELLAWHAAKGCIAMVLCEDGRSQPLLFRMIRRKGMPFAHLIYAESRIAVTRNLAPIMRCLLARGIFLLCVDAIKSDCPLGMHYRPTRKSFWKGEMQRDRIDYAYSELVLLGL